MFLYYVLFLVSTVVHTKACVKNICIVNNVLAGSSNLPSIKRQVERKKFTRYYELVKGSNFNVQLCPYKLITK